MSVDCDTERMRSLLLQRTRDNVLHGTRWISSADLNEVRRRSVDDPSQVIRCWLESRRVFSIEVDGECVIPLYALDQAGEPVAALQQIIDTLKGLDGFGMATFFESPSKWLGAKRPREVLQSQPQDALRAARARMERGFHG